MYTARRVSEKCANYVCSRTTGLPEQKFQFLNCISMNYKDLLTISKPLDNGLHFFWRVFEKFDVCPSQSVCEHATKSRTAKWTFMISLIL